MHLGGYNREEEVHEPTDTFLRGDCPAFFLLGTMSLGKREERALGNEMKDSSRFPLLLQLATPNANSRAPERHNNGQHSM